MQVRKKSKKKLVIVSLIVTTLLIAGGIAVYLLLSPSKGQNSNTPAKDTSETTKKLANPDTETSAETNNTKALEAEKNIQPSYEGENVNNSESLTGVVSHKSVTGSNLIIRTTINQTLSSGECKLTLVNGQKTITRTSDIAQNPSSSSCEGFDVPTSELGNGTWSISITITSGDRTGTIIDNVSL